MGASTHRSDWSICSQSKTGTKQWCAAPVQFKLPEQLKNYIVTNQSYVFTNKTCLCHTFNIWPFYKMKVYHISVFIGKDHASTVNKSFAWTAVNHQFRVHARSTFCPQLRPKQRHFLHKLTQLVGFSLALHFTSGRRRWPICWCCPDRGPGSFNVEDATTTMPEVFLPVKNRFTGKKNTLFFTGFFTGKKTLQYM